MIPLLAGLVLIAFTVFAALPSGLGWGPHIIESLKGGAPVVSGFLGLLIVFIGIADLKDAALERREEKEAEKLEAEKIGEKSAESS